MKYGQYSFSKIQTFFECPKKFEFSYVIKIPVDRDYVDPTYFVRGRFLHSYIADRLKGGTGSNIGKYGLDVDTKLALVDYADKALENEFISMTYDFDVNSVESYISLDKNLIPTTTKHNSAIGGYVDYFAIHEDYAMVVDWKTGKLRTMPDYSQLELYSVWLLQKYPKIEEIDLVYYYVEHDKFKTKMINSNDVKNLKNIISEKINIIENTAFFPVNRTEKCNHCQFFKTCTDTI